MFHVLSNLVICRSIIYFHGSRVLKLLNKLFFKVVVISWRIRGHVDFAHQVASAWITSENSMLCLIIFLRTTTHSQLLEDDVNKFNTFNSIKEISIYRYCKYIELSLKIDTMNNLLNPIR